LSRGWLECQKDDFDDDGNEELLVDGDAFSVYLSPKEGGSIIEWDIRHHSYNLCSTLARRPEAYHRVLTEQPPEKQTGEQSTVPSIHDLIRVKDKDSLRYLVYDKHPRSSLIEHFFSPDTKLEEFADQSYSELGDFVGEPYEFSVDKKGKEIRILLWRSGILRIDQKSLPFEVRKEIRLVVGEDKMHISYQLKNVSGSSIKAVFGSEWNINLLGGGHNEQAYYRALGITLDDSHLDSWGELADIELIAMGNRHLGIELELRAMPKVSLWRFPVESISNSEGGIEKVYQGSCLVMLLPLDLPPGEISKFNLVWRVNALDVAKDNV